MKGKPGPSTDGAAAVSVSRLVRWFGRAAIVLILGVLVVAFWQVLFVGASGPSVPKTTNSAAPSEDLVRDANVLQRLSIASQELSQRVRHAVVNIEAQHADAASFADDELRQLFGSPPSRAAVGHGSGVIVDRRGYILTNYHVIRSAEKITVVLDRYERFPAKVVGTDALTDLAVLKIEAQDLKVIDWGDSDELRVGAFVWAVGSPFGLEGSVSFGIVSAKNRDGLADSPFQEFLQTDAAINPGNSGGPLVDGQGRVVGINTAIIGQTYQGVSFALPSRTARDVFERLKETGRVSRGWLGVALDVVTGERAHQLGLPKPRGAYVVSVVTSGQTPSPARKAGIRVGDVLINWNGHPIDNPIQFSRLVAQSEIDSHCEVNVIRDGRQINIPIVIGERPASPD